VTLTPFFPRMLLLPALMLFGVSAQAQEVELGPGLVCDTQKQVERFVALYSGDVQAAVNAVNAEMHDPTACGLANMAFVRGPQLATARNKNTSFDIVQILVVGVANEAGSVQTVTPAVFYSLFPVEEVEI
jgi:hypothetical protein